MNAPTQLHAKRRPPSAAARWVPCPGSTVASQLYENDDSVHSEKGDYAHDVLETSIIFGIMQPETKYEDLTENLAMVLEWIAQTRAAYGPECRVYAEQVFEIPETGEFGTGDVTFVSPQVLHIADYKNGYVMVDVELNMQMLCYLLGAIAKYGERAEYKITVLQPNASHIDGPIRTYNVSQDDIDWFRQQIAWSMANEQLFVAGKHCKKTYCDHRGNCAVFLAYAQDNCKDAYWPTDIAAMSDQQLAEALDHADILQGLRDALRKAAMARILQQGRAIAGYKTVKSRQDRKFKGEQGEENVKRTLLDVFSYSNGDIHTQQFLSVKGVEDLIRAWSRKHGFGRGKWQTVWDNHIADHVLTDAGGITLERATDARPAYVRGSEFGALQSPGQMDGRSLMI